MSACARQLLSGKCRSARDNRHLGCRQVEREEMKEDPLWGPRSARTYALESRVTRQPGVAIDLPPSEQRQSLIQSYACPCSSVMQLSSFLVRPPQCAALGVACPPAWGLCDLAAGNILPTLVRDRMPQNVLTSDLTGFLVRTLLEVSLKRAYSPRRQRLQPIFSRRSNAVCRAIGRKTRWAKIGIYLPIHARRDPSASWENSAFAR